MPNFTDKASSRLPHGIVRPLSPLTADLVKTGRMNDIRERAQDLDKLATQIFETADSEGRDLSASERGKVESLLDERDQALSGLEKRKVDEGLSDGLPANAWTGGPGLPPRAISGTQEAPGARYASLFGDATDTHGFRSAEEFLSVLSSGRYDERLMIGSVMSEGVSSDGGFLVPPGFTAQLMDSSLENEVVRPRCKLLRMTGNELRCPQWDTSDNSSTLFGGFSGEWLSENASATKSYPKVRSAVLHAKKLCLYSAASNELVQDGLNFESQLFGALSRALGWFLDIACLSGTGAGQPLGILNDGALISVAKETGQAEATVNYTNLSRMYSRMHPSCVKNAIWVANPSVLPELLKLSIAIGTSGTHVPVLSESSGRFSVLGHEIIFSEKLPELGEEGDIMFVDFAQYILGLRADIRLERSNAPGWTEDQTDFRAIIRCDGMGAWSSVATPKNGDSLSWCVSLAVRG